MINVTPFQHIHHENSKHESRSWSAYVVSPFSLIETREGIWSGMPNSRLSSVS